MSPLARLDWLRDLAGDKRLPPSALAVAVVLASFINKDTGDARPAKATVAKMVGTDERAVRRMVIALQASGWLRVDQTAGRKCCTYTPLNPGTVTRVQPGQDNPGSDANPGRATRVPDVANPGRAIPPTRAPSPPEQGMNKEEQGERRVPRFAPPTLAEVSAYCAERSNGIDPQRFLDHYAAKGWMMGKSPVRNWRACVRTWEGRDRERIPITAEHPDLAVRYPTADEAAAALGILPKDNP